MQVSKSQIQLSSWIRDNNLQLIEINVLMEKKQIKRLINSNTELKH